MIHGVLWIGRVAVFMAMMGACSTRATRTAPQTGGVATTGGLVQAGGATGTGGLVQTGGAPGSPGDGGDVDCAAAVPCGGDVVGTWTVTSSCLTVSGQADMSLAGLGCPTAPVTGSRAVTGTWLATPQGTYVDQTTTSGTERLAVGAPCLDRATVRITDCAVLNRATTLPGYTSADCTKAEDGWCTCLATIEHAGGIGWVTEDPSTSGHYTTSGNEITLDGHATYTFCVAGDTMRWTPQTTAPTTMGAIVFRRQ